jgi:hypothetical protein
MRKDLSSQQIYEADVGDIAVTSELHARVKKGRWKGIWITKLPIRDKPSDGIDEFPGHYF